jgi:ABC-type siderophore export system fused ATPase/permease subunit
MMWSSMYNPEKPTIKRKADWGRVGAFFKPYWKHELLVLACILAGSVLGLLPPLFTKWIIDDAIPHHSERGVMINVGGMVASALAAGVIGVYQGYLNSLVGEGIMRDIRTSLVGHLHRMPLSFFTGTKTGEIMNRVSSDVDNIDNVVTGTLVSIVTNIATMVTTVVTIFILDWRLSLVALAVIPLMILPLNPVGRRMYDIRKLTRVKRDEIESITQETLSISGITLIKSFVREAFERQRFLAVGTDLMALEIRLAMVGRWFIAAVSAMVIVGPALVWLAGGWLAISGGLTIGTIVAFVAFLGRLYTPASNLAGVQVQVISALAVFERIFEYLDMKPEGDEKPDAIVLGAVRGDVAFDDVHFAYTSDRTALDGVTFHIEPGQMAAFVGPSGAGKTTITQLVPRFYDPQSGHARIAAPEHRHRHAGDVSLPRHDRDESALRARRRDRRADDRRGQSREHPRLHREPAAGLRDDRRRARAQALRWRAPTARDRARAAQGPVHPDPRRGDERARLQQRVADPGRARTAHGRSHESRDRAPALDDPQRRRDLRRRARPHRRVRHARAPAGARRRLRATLLEAVPRSRRGNGHRLRGCVTEHTRQETQATSIPADIVITSQVTGLAFDC